ncbi:hypothetical protein CMUST_11160 [Corynebacterium mustelae]|uniref:Carboxypeptidase regulatory-like domain-containing protein n=1 Tax=Corynebacterium mustelae TaxID=571915 RepID=A0A0G3H5W9_9CORY|nr:carboxypeptidase-like regulatory domain-containing protein [Corynebacterium mustelae]AKK06547.1 hypothetical protein CMUST_11160 [Corynebacterium mustelae]
MRKIVLTVLSTLIANTVLITVSANAMEESAVSQPLSCKLDNNGNAGRNLFPFADFGVKLNAKVVAPINVPSETNFNYTLKDLTVTIPNAHPEQPSASSFERISHARIDVPFVMSGNQAISAEVSVVGDAKVEAQGNRHWISGDATTDTLGSSEQDINSVTESKGITGVNNGSFYTVPFPDLTLKIPAGKQDQRIDFTLPSTTDYHVARNVSFTAAGVVSSHGKKFNVLFRCIPSSASDFPSVNVVSPTAAEANAIHFITQREKVNFGSPITITGLVLNQDGRPVTAGVPVTLVWDEHLRTPVRERVQTDKSGVFRYNYIPNSSDFLTERETVYFEAQIGGLISERLAIDVTNEEIQMQEKPQPTSIDISVSPETVSVGQSTSILVDLTLPESQVAKLPKRLSVNAGNTIVQAEQDYEKKTRYRASFTPTSTGKIRITVIFNDLVEFKELTVSQKGENSSGHFANWWKALLGVLGALGAVGLLVAAVANFLPQVFIP